jgi:hypothetical protein
MIRISRFTLKAKSLLLKKEPQVDLAVQEDLVDQVVQAVQAVQGDQVDQEHQPRQNLVLQQNQLKNQVRYHTDIKMYELSSFDLNVQIANLLLFS